MLVVFFFFNDTATTEIYTLSLHDALPIFGKGIVPTANDFGKLGEQPTHPELLDWLASDFMAGEWKLKRLHKLIIDRKSTRLNSSHANISYAVFCLKKKKNSITTVRSCLPI